MRFSVYAVWPSDLTLNNLKPHKTKAVKNIFIQEKFIPGGMGGGDFIVFRFSFVTDSSLPV